MAFDLRKLSKGNYVVEREEAVGDVTVKLERYDIPKGLCTPRMVVYGVIAERDSETVDLEGLGIPQRLNKTAEGAEPTYQLALERLGKPMEPNPALEVLKEAV